MEPHERKVHALVQHLQLIRNEKMKKRKLKEEEKRKAHEAEKAKNEELSRKMQREERRGRYREQEKLKIVGLGEMLKPSVNQIPTVKKHFVAEVKPSFSSFSFQGQIKVSFSVRLPHSARGGATTLEFIVHH